MEEHFPLPGIQVGFLNLQYIHGKNRCFLIACLVVFIFPKFAFEAQKGLFFLISKTGLDKISEVASLANSRNYFGKEGTSNSKITAFS